LVFGLLGVLLFVLRAGLLFGLLDGLTGALVFGILGALIGGIIGGADSVVKHYLLRLILWSQGHTPRNYARFLDHCAGLIFLRRVGGGYIFIHRMLMEHFAAMDEKDIERIVASIPKP
jgi:hypothetical protein